MPGVAGEHSFPYLSLQDALLQTTSSSPSPQWAPRHFEDRERNDQSSFLLSLISSFSEWISQGVLGGWESNTHTHTLTQPLLDTPLPCPPVNSATDTHTQTPIQMHPKTGVHKLIKICSGEGWTTTHTHTHTLQFLFFFPPFLLPTRSAAFFFFLSVLSLPAPSPDWLSCSSIT